jgi:Mrp family chromosome partitioning ATPase
MSKIEKTLIWAKQNRQAQETEKSMGGLVNPNSMPSRRLNRENTGEKWLQKLRVEVSTSIEHPESRVILSEYQDDRIRSAYKMLRTRTLQRIRQNHWQVIGVTSPLQGDGKTLTSINLALSLAREVTLSVILLELDLRRPSMCTQFGVTPDKGLVDYLNGSADLEEVLFRPDGTDRIAILPNTVVFEDSSETLSSPQIADLVNKLRGSDPGRIIICDLPPYLATDDVLAFAPVADAFLVVVSEGRTSREVLKKGLDILHDLPLLGVVLNRSEESTTGYYY